MPEYLLTRNERCEFVDQMSCYEHVFALSVLAGLYPLVFDEMAVRIGEARAEETRRRVRAQIEEVGR